MMSPIRRVEPAKTAATFRACLTGLSRIDSIALPPLPPRIALVYTSGSERSRNFPCNVSGRLARSVIGENPAMTTSQSDTDELRLLRAAANGDEAAVPRLLARHRGRLRQMVAVYLDHRLAARVDPSDVVQEALADATQGLTDYLRERPLPFYPWLRQFAWQRLLQLHRHHIQARRRSVEREVPWDIALPDHSADALADCLLASGTSPSRRMMREEVRRRVRAAMDRLAERDREILVMRHLEEMSAAEIAAILGISAGAVRVRLLRALTRLRNLLGDGGSEAQL
jgi:RNA polymerase sigma-70 factor, ECF subfamily